MYCVICTEAEFKEAQILFFFSLKIAGAHLKPDFDELETRLKISKFGLKPIY